MRRILRPRHYNDLASGSQRTYGYYWVDYERYVLERNLPLFAPGDEALTDYLEAEADISLSRAQHRIRAIAWRFSEEGLPDPTASLQIREQIYQLHTEQREQRLEILGIVPKAARRYAAYFNEGRYAESTLLMFTQRGQSWELYALRHGFDPQHPPTDGLVTYVRRFSDTSFGNQSNLVRALQYYFESRGLPDATLCEEIDLLLENAKRRTTGTTPLFLDDVRRMVGTLGSDKLDKRDHLIVLLNYFAGLMPTPQSRLLFEDIVLVGDGGLSIRIGDREIFLDGYPEEPGLDVVGAFLSYCGSVEWNSGPVFRSLGLRGEYLPCCSPGAIGAGVVRTARLAGITVPSPCKSLCKGFEIECVKRFNVIITARHLGLHPTSVASQVPEARIELDQIQRLPRGKRRPKNPRARRRRSSARIHRKNSVGKLM